MNNRWRLIALWALPLGLVVFFGFQVIRGGGPMQVANGPTVAPRNSAVARIGSPMALRLLPETVPWHASPTAGSSITLTPAGLPLSMFMTVVAAQL